MISNRLNRAIEILRENNCDVLADIGCDHGITAKMALDEGLIKEVIAADISQKSLEKAEKLLNGYPNASFALSDGFKSLPKRVDCAVIMGMGGNEISKIIMQKENTAHSLIVQPQNCKPLVRQTLLNKNYIIVFDSVVEDSGKFYDIIFAKKAGGSLKTDSFDEVQLEWGIFYKEKSAVLLKKLLKTEKALLSYKLTLKNKEKLDMIKEVKKWQL